MGDVNDDSTAQDPGPQPPATDGPAHVRRMLTELAFPAGAMREQHRELERCFADALGPQMGLLTGAESKGDGESHFAVRHLLARAMSDLIVSLHLITHGYLTQAYNALRMAYETLDLVELLATEPGEAERWVNTEKGHVEFRPGAVRERLGRPSFDEVYSQISEFAHPRFKASKLSTVAKRREGSDELTVVAHIGPFMLDELPDHWLLAMFLVPTVGMLSARLGHLTETGAVKKSDWQTAALSTQTALSEMAKLIEGQLSQFDIDASAITQEYAGVRSVIENAPTES